jgi:2-polyprenyl-3-methyl-5-hydroxy-6-metoxy-1,4-benzoquinol methylase
MADSRWWKDLDAVLAAALPAGSRILDAGCGDGGLVDRLAELGFDAVGVDPAAPVHPRLLKERVEEVTGLGGFDAVTAVMSLHHGDLEAVVRALANSDLEQRCAPVTAGCPAASAGGPSWHRESRLRVRVFRRA